MSRNDDPEPNRAAQRNRRLALLLPVVVLAVGIGLGAYLIVSEPAPEKREAVQEGILVETTSASKAEHQLRVRAQGSVRAVNEVALIPQVSGNIVEISPNLIAGGFVREGELLYRIDPGDYRVELERQQAALEEAKASLELEQGQNQVAQREWELLGESLAEDQKAPALALREPQLQQAKAAVSSAEAAVAGAKLQLERTHVRAPFDAVVASETVALGQQVAPQGETARLVGMDRLHVHTVVPVKHLPLINVGEQGSRARVAFDLGENSAVYYGTTVRLLPQLAESSRMAQVLVEIREPFERFLENREAGGPTDAPPSTPRREPLPLLIDSFVNVAIEVPETIDAVELQRQYLHNGDQVWVMRNDKLHIRQVNVAWERPRTVLIDAGLEDGEAVVTTPIANPVEGLALRTEEDERSPAEGQGNG